MPKISLPVQNKHFLSQAQTQPCSFHFVSKDIPGSDIMKLKVSWHIILWLLVWKGLKH